MKTRIIGLIILSFSWLHGQNLVINEVSQGASGAKEYVELIVVDTLNCEGVPCIDLRGYILDDNNGYFASGSGTGIAPGALRFSDSTFWSCVPAGTSILIYNNEDFGTTIPLADSSLNDNNCQLILPVNTHLLEMHPTTPNITDSSFPNDGWISGGNWSTIAMSNNNDSFQVFEPGNTTTPISSVSWGNNNSNTLIYFSGSATNLTFGLHGNQPLAQSDWQANIADTFESPGIANSESNNIWINSMSNNCSPFTALNFADINSISPTCSYEVNGTYSISINGGYGEYTTWINNEISSNEGTLPVGSYTIIIEDELNCSIDTAITISQGDSIQAHIDVNNLEEFAPFEVLLSATNSFNAINYQWIINNESIGNQENESFSISAPGSYDIMLVTVNTLGCTDTAYANFTIGEVLPLNPPNIFTPNNDGNNDFFHLNSNYNGEVIVNIYSRWGNLILTYQGFNFEWDGKVNGGKNANEGVYYYTVETVNKDLPLNYLNGFVHLLR